MLDACVGVAVASLRQMGALVSRKKCLNYCHPEVYLLVCFVVQWAISGSVVSGTNCIPDTNYSRFDNHCLIVI